MPPKLLALLGRPGIGGADESAGRNGGGREGGTAGCGGIEVEAARRRLGARECASAGTRLEWSPHFTFLLGLPGG